MTCVTAVFVAAFCAACVVASANARASGPAGPMSIHIKFRADGTQNVLTTSPYVFFPGSGTQRAGRLVDDQTSNSWQVPNAPGCSPGTMDFTNADGGPLIGPGRLLGVCPTNADFELYSLPAGPWRALAPSAECAGFSSLPGMSECAAVAVGRDWIQLAYSCYHCKTFYRYQSIATGLERPYTPAPHAILDLSSPTLRQPVCPPLNVPPHGSLTFDGNYAVAQTTAGSFLEHCGSEHFRERLGKYTEQLTYTPRVILWLASENGTSATLGGVVLRTGRAFTIALPSAIAIPGVHGLSITPRHIYIFSAHVVSAHNYVPRLYVANLPKALRTG